MTIGNGAVVRVRRAGEHDVPVIQGLLSELHAQHYDSMPERFLPQAMGETNAGMFRSWLTDPSQCLLVAERSGRMAGYSRAEVRSTPDSIAHRGRTWAEVHEVCVAAKSRRSGAGRLLMEETRAWAKGQNASSLELAVYAFNETALDFYRRIGMRELRVTLTMATE